MICIILLNVDAYEKKNYVYNLRLLTRSVCTIILRKRLQYQSVCFDNPIRVVGFVYGGFGSLQVVFLDRIDFLCNDSQNVEFSRRKQIRILYVLVIIEFISLYSTYNNIYIRIFTVVTVIKYFHPYYKYLLYTTSVYWNYD